MRFVLAPLQKTAATHGSIILFKLKTLNYAYREQISRQHATRLPHSPTVALGTGEQKRTVPSSVPEISKKIISSIDQFFSYHPGDSSWAIEGCRRKALFTPISSQRQRDRGLCRR